MTTPNGDPLPDGFPMPQPSTENFGPDTSASENVEYVPPKVNQKNPPKATSSVFGKLGTSRKRNSGVPQLAAEDREKIADLYAAMAMPVMMFKPDTAQAMVSQADACADAWMKLAKENDRVRRVVRAVIEGGVWGQLITAHGPILMTVLPENLPQRLSAMLTRVPNDASELSDEQ